MLMLIWNDKKDGDVIFAKDINDIAHAVQDLEGKENGGAKIVSAELNAGRDCKVNEMYSGSVDIASLGLAYGDVVVDTEGGCFFQYVESWGMLQLEGLICIANPNAKGCEVTPDVNTTQCTVENWISNVGKITFDNNGQGCFVKVKENTLYKITVKGKHNRFYVNGCMRETVLNGAPTYSIYDAKRSTVTEETESCTFYSTGYKSVIVTISYGVKDPNVSVELTEINDGVVIFDETKIYTADKVNRLIEPLTVDGITYTTASDMVGAGKTTEIYALYDALVAKYPDYITKQILGQNSKGTEIREYTFTSGDFNDVSTPRTKDAVKVKPTILIISGVHGDEKSAVMATYQFMRDMASYTPTLYAMRDGLTFKVIPIVAPYAYDNSRRVNENGVNVNRNFDYNWAATANDGMNYAGAAPADQAEAQILQAWFEANSNAVLCIDHHNSAYLNEVSMIYGNEDKVMPEIKRLYLQGLARVTPYWEDKKDFPNDSIFAYTGFLSASGMLIDYAQNKGITSVCLETSWDQNSMGLHSAGTVAVCAEALGNMLLEIYEGICTEQLTNVGNMSFKGTVNALPETAREGDVYKVGSGLKWTEYATGVRFVTVGASMSNNNFDIYIYGDSGTEAASEEIIKAVEACGTTPAPIKIVQHGTEYIINVESYERYINTDDMPPVVGCTFYGVTNVESYTELAHSDESDTIDIYYGAAESKTYVYHNGAWVEI